MRNYKITQARKIRIVEIAENSGNIRNTARKFKVQPSQIRQWRKNIQEIRIQAETSPGKLTLNHGPKLENSNLEDVVYQWVIDQRKAELAFLRKILSTKHYLLTPRFVMTMLGS